MRNASFVMLLGLTFVIPWENMLLLGGLGTVGRGTGLLVAAFWLATLALTGRFRRPQLFHIMVFAFVLWNAASAFWSVDIDATTRRIVTYTQLAVLVMIVWDVCNSERAVRALLQAYVLGAYVAVGGLFSNYIAAGGAAYDHRLSAEGFNANDLALILALAVPMAWYLAALVDAKTRYWLTLANYAYIPTALVSISLTASRGALLALVPAFLFIAISLTRFKLYQRIVLFVVVVGSVLALQPLVPKSSLERFATTGAEVTEGNLNGRLPIWRESIALMSEHAIVGVGSGGMRTAATQTGKVTHNVVLSMLVEVGLVGFALFMAVLGIATYHATRPPKWASRFWLTMLLVWALGGLTHNVEEKKTTWLLLSLILVSSSLSTRREQAGSLTIAGQALPLRAQRAVLSARHGS